MNRSFRNFLNEVKARRRAVEFAWDAAVWKVASIGVLGSAILGALFLALHQSTDNAEAYSGGYYCFLVTASSCIFGFGALVSKLFGWW